MFTQENRGTSEAWRHQNGFFASFAVLCVFALRILHCKYATQRRKGPQSSRRSFIVLAGKKFLLFLDDSSLEPADDVDGCQDDHHDQQNDLYSFEITDQLLDARGKRETEASQHANANQAARKRKRREPQKPEVHKSVENRARGPKPVDVFHYEYRQHAEPVHELFNSRTRARKEVPVPGSPAKSRADHVAQRVTDKPARGAYD